MSDFVLTWLPRHGWMLCHAEHPELAWSGASWVHHHEGMHFEGCHVLVFETDREADLYVAMLAVLRPSIEKESPLFFVPC